MTYQPKHEIETSDLRGSEPIVVKPGDISIGDLPNSDTATDDMRGHEPPPITDPEADHSKMIIGAVVAAVVIGGAAIYTAGMWSAAPRAPAPMTRVATTTSAPPALAAAVPQQAVIQPPAIVQATPPNEVVQTPASAHIAKRAVAPSRSPVVRAVPKPIPAPPAAMSPEIMPPNDTPLIAVPQGPTGALPEPPATEPTQSLPDQPVPPAQSPQPTPTQPPQ